MGCLCVWGRPVCACVYACTVACVCACDNGYMIAARACVHACVRACVRVCLHWCDSANRLPWPTCRHHISVATPASVTGELGQRMVWSRCATALHHLHAERGTIARVVE